MKNVAVPTVDKPTASRSAVLNYFSLFSSVSTLLCCALPSLLVLFGLGASVASMLSFVPWLVALSRHNILTFSISGALIACSFLNTYYILPRLTKRECSPDNPDACAEASRLSAVLLWASAAIYAVGFFVAFVLGPILSKIDNA
jgi:mercuric ion transport protein